MMAKIEWYEEVLALEPGSRLFFPFARCLVEQGLRERAVEVLRAGLAVHPEHMEARILLIHLLDEQGDAEGGCAESRRIADVLMSYPGFWKSLGDAVGQTHGSDVALCLQFVAAALRDPSVTLAGMVARGLGIVGENTGASEAGGYDTSSTQLAGQPVSDAQLPVEKSGQKAEDQLAKPAAGPLGLAEQALDRPAEQASVPQADEPVQFVAERIETDETVSLKTRSMAQILAEQGDLDGALIIYEELAAQEPDSAELRRRICELKRQKADGGDRSRYGNLDTEAVTVPSQKTLEASTASAPQESKQSGGNVVALLESLADRLEARAGA